MIKNSTNFEEYSQDEIKQLAVEILLKIENPQNGIGKELFDVILKVVPQVAVEAIVVDDIKNPKKVLFIERDDEYYKGWHFTGGFMKFGETIQDRLVRVVEKELGTSIKNVFHTGKFNELFDKRGHSIALLFLVEINGQPKVGKWFGHIPKEILPHHKKILQEALGWG